MKAKNSVLLGLLAVLFVGVAGMFYYENFYKGKAEEKDLVSVLAIKKDIAKGVTLNEDNIGFVKVHKSMVSESNVLDFKDVETKTSYTEMFKGELLNIERVNEDKDGEGKYLLSVSQSNKLSQDELEAGDTVRVFVKPKNMSQLFEVLNAKDIQKVNTRVTNSGKDTGEVTQFNILASDKEVELYERAISVGDIIVTKYENLAQADLANILPYDDNKVLIEQIGESGKSTKSRSYFGHIHEVAEGQNWATIAKEYKTNENRLKELNKSVAKLDAGIYIRVN